MAFTPNLPNQYDINLIPRSVRNKYFSEVLFQTPLSMFMGEGNDALIQVVHRTSGTGQTVSFAFGREIDYKNPIIGYDQITGTGQNVKFYYDELRVKKQALSDKLEGISIVDLDTPIKVFDALRPKLSIAHKRNIVFSILKAATFDAYPNLAAGPSANRVLYAGAAYDASILTAVAAQNTGLDYNENGLSVKHIRACRDLAIYGGVAFESEKRISPYMMTTQRGFAVPTYLYFMDTPSYVSLTGDPDWRNYFQRGIIESADQPTGLSGAFYKGMIDNVMIYEVPELGNFHVTAGGVTDSWNLFCGAQAFGLAWGKEPWFTQEITNHGNEVEMAVQEIRGQKALMFPSFANEEVSVEHGIIHSFVRIQ